MSITSHWDWMVRQAARQLWLTVVLYVIAGLVSVLLGAVFAPLIPEGFRDFVSAEAVDRVLGILASSMLAVTTFSLATMVTAHGAVTGNTSPRATTLVLDNEVTRHALGVFIGSFLFSLVGIVALKAGVYGESGHVVLFALTVVVILLIVIALLRWIEHLSQLVRVSETTDRVETATRAALEERAQHPGLGASACQDIAERIPAEARVIAADGVGYVRHIDMKSLIDLARERELEMFVQAPPGVFVGTGHPLLCVAGTGADDIEEDSLRELFSLGATRTFDYDPRFGLVVLAEIASRALSPGINDPGTAIDVIGRVTRLLSGWARVRADGAGAGEAVERRVWLPEIVVEDMLDDAFTPIARDGAGIVSVQLRLQKALAALSDLGDVELRDAAVRQSRQAWARAEAALAMDFDRERVEALVLDKPG